MEPLNQYHIDSEAANKAFKKWALITNISEHVTPKVLRGILFALAAGKASSGSKMSPSLPPQTRSSLDIHN